MATPDKFCSDLVSNLDHWIGEVQGAFDGRASHRVWYYEEAFERARPALARIAPEDLRAILEDFGVALIHSLLQSLEQKKVHATTGRKVALVDADTQEPLPEGLDELFIETLTNAREANAGR